MSAISDFVSKQTQHNADVDTALDTINTSVADVVTEVANLNATIQQLQNSPGTITPEDQALLDKADASGQALATKAAAAAAAAKAADTLTPPVAPPAAATP